MRLSSLPSDVVNPDTDMQSVPTRFPCSAPFESYDVAVVQPHLLRMSCVLKKKKKAKLNCDGYSDHPQEGKTRALLVRQTVLLMHSKYD